MHRFIVFISLISGLTVPAIEADAGTKPDFEIKEIDSNIQIGYGVVVADVDGDSGPDIILADKHHIAWYRNPSWSRHIMVEHLTKEDNVCLAAMDTDNDGKAEIAVGAGWNPGDTENSGAVFTLLPPADRTRRWTPVRQHHEPTVHRMRWYRTGAGGFALAVLPLHGRGNKDASGVGAKFMSYKEPDDPSARWETGIIDDTLHATHNFDVVKWTRQPGDEFLVASKEGIFHMVHSGNKWTKRTVADTRTPGFKGAEEVRAGDLGTGGRFVAAIEPMHGNEVVVYTEKQEAPGSIWHREVIDNTIREGHALAAGDLLGIGSDQLVMGWRAKNDDGQTGIKLYTPRQTGGWTSSRIDDGIACEDLCVADLNKDGRLDLIASGRATRNLRIYLNKGSPGEPAGKR